MDTKRKILDTALSLLNAKGLKNVTARVICEQLNISPGSFSYHFPDKTLIIRTLYEEMQAELIHAIVSLRADRASIIAYLEMHRKGFMIQNKYKFFYLNLFEILTSYEDIRQIFLENNLKERQLAKEIINVYIKAGILKTDIDKNKRKRLVDVGQILNTFWPLDAEITFVQNEKGKLIHYMKICCGLLEPYLETDSLKEYNYYFENLES